MKTLELPDAIWEYFAAFQVFRGLGFSADDIHFVIFRPYGKTAAMLKCQDKEFMVATGEIPGAGMPEVQNLLEELESFLEVKGSAVMHERYLKTEIARKKAALVALLLQDGFQLPYKLN